jgi:hypothetical protein
MLSVMLAAAMLLQEDARAPRAWSGGDSLVRFAEGSRISAVRPVGRWSGTASIQVRCVIVPEGRLEACEVVREAAAGRVSVRDALQAFRQARIELTPQGPHVGDTYTAEIVVTQDRIRRR